MSFSFLFGNVDEKGRLERKEVDQVVLLMQEIFETVEASSEYLTTVIGTLEVPDEPISDEPGVKHNDNAVDYSDFQELAEDLLPMPLPPQLQIKPMVPVPQITYKDYNLSEIFPGFQKGKRLKFCELFTAKVPKSYNVYRLEQKKPQKQDFYPLKANELSLIHKAMAARYSSEEKITDSPTIEIKINMPELEGEETLLGIKDSASLHPIVLDSWEKNIIWDSSNDRIRSDKAPAITLDKTAMFRNTHLENEKWLDSISWDIDKMGRKVEFHMDDPTIVILQSEAQEIKNPKSDKYKIPFYTSTPDGKIVDRFNIADDWYYDKFKRGAGGRYRQSVGTASVVHSLPAILLHPQYFKPLLQVKDLRSHHRPSIKFAPNENFTFSRVKPIKKKKLKEIDPTEMMKTPKDITLKDTSKYMLAEYCEEYPPVLQNAGMASLVYNYYRKKDDKDNFMPKLHNGAPNILESVDASPFFGYGDVKPGQTMQVLYNNLFRAPIFLQNKLTNDFLVIRHTYHGETKYFIREIPLSYIVGQCYPLQDIPRPQSRKITQCLKMRLQVVAYRLMRKDPYKRLRYEKLRKVFSMYTDAQIRQKLKEFAQYLKKGENTGWWKLKPNVVLPDEDGIRKLMTPETICVIQSTLVGQQRLKDAGYGLDDYKEGENENEEEESHLDIEIQLAPWTTTKNFLVAATGKGMMKLFGPGDPTGIGEGFSFIRASMKEMFFKDGETEQNRSAFIDAKAKTTFHKYSIIEQQLVYRAEVERIWKSQMNSLTPKPPNAKEEVNQQKKRLEAEHAKKQEEDDEATSTLGGKNKMLVINRLVKKAEGKVEWVSEVVTNVRIINAYLRYRKLIEQPVDSNDQTAETEEQKLLRIKRNTKDQIVKLQIKQGKKPTLPDAEEITGLKFAEDGAVIDVSKQSKVGANPNQSPALSKKRKNQDEVEYSKPTKRRTDPLVELADLFEAIIAQLIGSQDTYYPFCHPVSQHAVPDYYKIVSEPMALELIREKIRNYNYVTESTFLADVELIVHNSRLYNGPSHSLTITANLMLQKVVDYLKTNQETLRRLEHELQEDRKPKIAVNQEPQKPDGVEPEVKLEPVVLETQENPNANPPTGTNSL